MQVLSQCNRPCFRLLFFFFCYALVHPDLASSQESGTQAQESKLLVKEALEAELQGSRDQRNSLLQAAIDADPSNSQARWHSGQVSIEKDDGTTEWMTIEEVESQAASNSELDEYTTLRQSQEDDLKSHELLASWCNRRGQVERAKAHWSRVLDLNPGHRKAIARLGLQSYQGRWMTRDQVASLKDQQRTVSKIQREWRPTVATWKRNFTREDVLGREAICSELKEAARPELIGMFETQLAPVDEQLGIAVVEATDNVPEQVATESLLRLAAASEYRAVKREAIERLKKRSLHGYVPILIDAMMAPLQFQSWSVQSPFDSGQVLAMNYMIGQQGKHVDRMMRGSVNFVGSGDSESAEDAHEEIQGRIAKVNAARERFNQPLAQVLQSTTGQNFGANPVQWNDWWNNFNEYLVPDFRPVMTSFQSPSQVFVASRPFACFPAGTLVSTESGKKPIEEIQVGDFVLSKNAATGELCYQAVQQTTVRDSDAILEVIIGRELLRVTRGHPMWVSGKEWQMAKQLQPGSLLHGADGPVEVRAMRHAHMRAPVYNLVVSDFHTYFVGDSRVLVHDNTLYTPPGVSVPGLSTSDLPTTEL